MIYLGSCVFVFTCFHLVFIFVIAKYLVRNRHQQYLVGVRKKNPVYGKLQSSIIQVVLVTRAQEILNALLHKDKRC